MDIYQRYREYVKEVVQSGDISQFKSHPNYMYMLEHVNETQGKEYIACILKEFPEIHIDEIVSYICKNDCQGNPTKLTFDIGGHKVTCSPTSLRYIFQALLILKHYKTTGLKKMVEVGCGYGGLFLAIHHFAKHLNIPIDIYYMIDFEDVTHLIHKYLSRFDAHQFPEEPLIFETYVCDHYGADIEDDDLFFISNYAFTEIGKAKMMHYKACLLPKVRRGFITYQTSYDVKLEDLTTFVKPIDIELERPQTAHYAKPNYYVTF